MANIKISQLPEATKKNDTDIIPIVQDGTTKKITAEDFIPNEIKTLTSETWEIRIWDLEDGVYKIPGNYDILYKGATDNTSIYIYTTSYLFVTSYGTTRKQFFILAGNSGTQRLLYNGYTQETLGAVKEMRLDSSYLTSISSYVKDVLTYSTSGTTYALSAYQGYLLNQNKADKTAFTGTDGVTAGAIGIVPAPATTDANKFLNSDGAWESLPITYSTTDITAGVTPLPLGALYIVYE